MDNPQVEVLDENDVIPFTFKGVRLEQSCWPKGVPCFTAKSIGKFLGYKHPQKAIDNIVARNPWLNDSRWSVALKMRATDGKEYRTKVSNIFGFLEICNISRSRVGKNLQPALRELRYRAYGNKLFQPASGPIAGLAYAQPRSLGKAQKLLEVAETTPHLSYVQNTGPGVSKSTSYRYGKRAEECGPPNKRAKGLRTFKHKHHRDLYPEVIALRQRGLTYEVIARQTGVTYPTVAKWCKDFRDTGQV